MRKGKGDIKGQRKRRRERAKVRRAAWLAEHGPCCKCGSWERLELDHIVKGFFRAKNAAQSRPSQSMWNWSEPRRQTELAKCQVLCFRCHRIKSGLENRKYDHGLNLYERHGCRCQICRDANAAAKRRQRKRRAVKIAFSVKGGVSASTVLA